MRHNTTNKRYDYGGHASQGASESFRSNHTPITSTKGAPELMVDGVKRERSIERSMERSHDRSHDRIQRGSTSDSPSPITKVSSASTPHRGDPSRRKASYDPVSQ